MATFNAAKLSDLAENQPTEAEHEGTKVVLVRQGDRVHALAGLCPHKKVPLAKGIVADGQIVCGVHRAAFDLETGDVVKPPACENLARYDVEIDGDDVRVTIPDGQTEHPLPASVTRKKEGRHFVVIGAGAAGWRCAETLRRATPHGAGFEGRITVITDEAHLPYDRTDLSKSFLSADDPGPVAIRTQAQIDAQQIDVVTCRVEALDPNAKTLTLDKKCDGPDTLAFDKLCIATGSDARRLDVPGHDLEGIHVIRTLSDAKHMRADLKGALARASDGPMKAVIVGGGFIGLEAASAMAGKDEVELTVVLRDAVPFANLFGEAFGKRLKREHEDAGVRFVEGEVSGFTGKNRVAGVQIENGEALDANLVVVAVGATPRTDWLPFEREKDGGVAVADDLSVPGHKDIFLAGDIARVPTNYGPARIEHWRFAQELGELAALNMSGASKGYDGTPFFWSMQQIPGSYTYTGHAEGWDEIRGDVDDTDFRADFVKDGEVRAVLAHGIMDEVTEVEPKMRGKGPLKAA